MFKNSALIIHNVQVDYCPGGAVEVPNGDLIIKKINDLMGHFNQKIAAIDWHPANHISFAGNHLWRKIGQTMSIDGLDQKLMPFHCVSESFGAHLHPSLDSSQITHTIQQGVAPNIDNYSAFFDVDKRRDTGLTNYLKNLGITKVFVVGLGIEFGVKNTILDAIPQGFKTVVIQDACAGWEEKAIKETWKELEKAGSILVNADRLLSIST